MRRDGKGPVVPASDSSLHRNPDQQAALERIADGQEPPGLIVMAKRASSSATVSLREDTPPSEAVKSSGTPPAETADEAARRALVSGASNQNLVGVNDHLTIPVGENAEQQMRQDLDQRPDEPTLETYAAIPVEGFGAALLRGMGWQEGMGAGRNRNGPSTASLTQRRPQLLGLGAKERTPIDTSSKGAGSSKHRGSLGSTRNRTRPDPKYMPLVRRETQRNDGSDYSSDSRRREDDARREGKVSLLPLSDSSEAWPADRAVSCLGLTTSHETDFTSTATQPAAALLVLDAHGGETTSVFPNIPPLIGTDSSDPRTEESVPDIPIRSLAVIGAAIHDDMKLNPTRTPHQARVEMQIHAELWDSNSA